MNNKILGLIVFVLSLQMSRERSAVWEFYKKDSSGAAICTLCASEISQESKSNVKNATNLWQHLKVIYIFCWYCFFYKVYSWKAVILHLCFIKGCDFEPNKVLFWKLWFCILLSTSYVVKMYIFYIFHK